MQFKNPENSARRQAFGKLLVVAPHFRVFIKEQVTLIRSYFKETNVLIPLPYLSKIVLLLPIIKDNFSFLELRKGPDYPSEEIKVVFSKFATLPIGILRRRNHLLASKSCLKTLDEKNLEFNLIHAHFLSPCGYIGAVLREKYSVPLVLTVHGGDIYDLPFKYSWYRALTRYVLDKADAIVAVSRFNAGKLVDLGASTSKLHVVPNGFNEKLFKPRSLSRARRLLGLPSTKKILLSVGGLVDVKGHVYLIDAMQSIIKRRKDVILVIVGSGPLEKSLRKRIKVLGLGDFVLLTGSRMHEEIPLWMNACNLFILPSLNEGFGKVVIEAMACGKPAIGTNVGGVPEIIRCSDVGILVKPADPKMLADAILKALEKTWNHEFIVNYVKQYSWTNITKQILEIYRKILVQ